MLPGVCQFPNFPVDNQITGKNSDRQAIMKKGMAWFTLFLLEKILTFFSDMINILAGGASL
jgi:hypothetical protein